MKSPASENWPWNFLLALAAGLVIVSFWLLLSDICSKNDSAQARAARQLTYSLKAAHTFERQLFDTMGVLAELADSTPDELGFQPLLENARLQIGPQRAAAVFVQKNDGSLLEQAPGQALSSRFASADFLRGAPSSLSAPQLLSVENETLLLLSLPLSSDPSLRASVLLRLGAMLDELLTRISHPLALDFLLDEESRFLLHRDPSLIGRSAEEAFASDEDLLDMVQEMLRGGQDSRFFTPKTAEPFSGQRLLSYAQIRGPSGTWSLALTAPAAAMGEGDQLPSLPPLLALALSLFLAFFCADSRRRFRAKSEQLSRCSEESAQRLDALEQSRSMYRHLLHNAGDALFFIDPDNGRLLDLNIQTESLLQYSAEELRQFSLSVLFPGRHHRRYLSLVRRVLEHGYGEINDLCFKRKDGSCFIGAVHARHGKLGSTQVVHGVLRDVSDIKRIETELRQKNRDLTLLNEMAHQVAESHDLKQMLATILSQLTQTFAMDGGGIYLLRDNATTLNLEAQLGVFEALLPELRSLSAGVGLVGQVALTGHPKSSANLAKDRRLYVKAVREAGWRSLQAIPLATREKTLGVLFLFSLNARILSREEISLLLAIGKQVGTAVEGADLMDALRWQFRLTQASNRELQHSRKQLRQSLDRMAEANQALERIDRMKSNFLSLASHELRTPLTYVLAGSQLLETTLEGRVNKEEKSVLEAITQGAQRLEHIVQDLLEAARLESSSIYLAREPIDLSETLNNLCDEFAPRTAARDIHLSLEALEPDLFIYGDGHHLAKTFSRLLENALKFTPQNGRVSISAKPIAATEILEHRDQLQAFSPNFFRQTLPQQLVQVTITDSGVGIDANEQLRVFDRFYEVGEITHHFTSKESFGGKGVGMGLALVKGMVEAHGGMVWVDSPGTGVAGGGSRFHLLLPTALQENSAAVSALVRETDDDNDPFFSGYTP